MSLTEVNYQEAQQEMQIGITLNELAEKLKISTAHMSEITEISSPIGTGPEPGQRYWLVYITPTPEEFKKFENVFKGDSRAAIPDVTNGPRYIQIEGDVERVQHILKTAVEKILESGKRPKSPIDHAKRNLTAGAGRTISGGN